MNLRFFRHLWIRWRFVLVIVMFLIGVFLNLYAFTLFIKPKSPISQTSYKVERELTVNPSSVTDISPKVTLSKKINQLESNKTKLGHFLYAEGDFSQMLIVASYAPHEYQRFERLAPEAALALMKLIYAARNEGVWIIPVSGFRSVAAQEKLFQKQIEKQGSPEKAAKLSAPPGYSEHATGYAIDLADGNFPKQDITNQFAETKAFQWLTLHAKEFGFEMSFPKNNPQGVSYEPWHWRYIGSSHAAAIFTNAKNSRF